MMVYVVTRYFKRDTWQTEEVVSVYSDKKSATEFCKGKNSIHDALQPYVYKVIIKKVKTV